MKIAVVGTGHVGLVTAAALAAMGHDVVGVDDDAEKVAAVNAGRLPFFESGLGELVEQASDAGTLRLTHDPSDAVPGREVAFICVGTPSRPDGEANLLAVERAAATVAGLADRAMVVAHKSTVPVQTAHRVETVLRRCSRHDFCVVSNPEFLREGRAVQDALRPDRILVGSDRPWGHRVMRRVYEPLVAEGVPYFETDVVTAELAKHACNAFLALKVSYANAVARICEASGADVSAIADVMGSDGRIGRAFLGAGMGYGGYCLPKDVSAFREQARRLGYEFRLLDEIVGINEEALDATFEKVKEALWNLEGKRVAPFGLAFKPGTDDVREAPALRLASRLIDAGASVVGHDPMANAGAEAALPGLETSDDPYEAAEAAHCVVVCTEWPEFAAVDLARLKGAMTQPVVVDGRNLLDPAAMAGAGFTYLPTGRPAVNL